MERALRGVHVPRSTAPLLNMFYLSGFAQTLALMNRENAQEPGSHVNVDVIPTVGMDRT